MKMETKNWKSPYEFYYSVFDDEGNVKYSSVNQQDCLNYISHKFETEQKLLSMEQLPVHNFGMVTT